MDSVPLPKGASLRVKDATLPLLKVTGRVARGAEAR